ncbi:hypothetical protein QZ287_22265, partial [Brevibacillus laterosporus]|uniref:hypothetical protein n=1 Tax=Brevibacillus laterosporus TaxID=1465 RepID=UPI00265C2308
FELALVFPTILSSLYFNKLIKTQKTRKKVTFFKVSILRVTVQAPGKVLFYFAYLPKAEIQEPIHEFKL